MNVTTNTARKPAFCQPKALLSLTNVNDLAILLSHIKEATMLTLVLFLFLACGESDDKAVAAPIYHCDAPQLEQISPSASIKNIAELPNASSYYVYNKDTNGCMLMVDSYRLLGMIPIDCETIGYTPAAQQEAPL
jgi:hypothetical protein